MPLSSKDIQLISVDSEKALRLKFKVLNEKAVQEFMSDKTLQEFLTSKFGLLQVSGRDLKIVYDKEKAELTLAQNKEHLKTLEERLASSRRDVVQNPDNIFLTTALEGQKEFLAKEYITLFNALVTSVISYIVPPTEENVAMLSEIAAHVKDQEFVPNHYRSEVYLGARKLQEHFEASFKNCRHADQEVFAKGRTFLVAFDKKAMEAAKLRERQAEDAAAEHHPMVVLTKVLKSLS